MAEPSKLAEWERADLLADMKACEETVAQARKTLGLPPAVFPHPTTEYEKTLLDNSTKCPLCGSTDLTAKNYDGGPTRLCCDVECNSCGDEWTELYALYKIE